MSNDLSLDQKIDLFNLDQNAAEQAELVMEWGKKWVTAKRDKKEARKNLDIVKATLDEDIRENPSKYGLEKITEGAIQAKILLSTDYQEAQDMLLQSEYEEDMFSIAFQAIVERGKMIEVEQRFHAAAYFATTTKVYTEGKSMQVEQKQDKALNSNKRLAKFKKEKGGD